MELQNVAVNAAGENVFRLSNSTDANQAEQDISLLKIQVDATTLDTIWIPKFDENGDQPWIMSTMYLPNPNYVLFRAPSWLPRVFEVPAISDELCRDYRSYSYKHSESFEDSVANALPLPIPDDRSSWHWYGSPDDHEVGILPDWLATILMADWAAHLQTQQSSYDKAHDELVALGVLELPFAV